MSNRRQRAQGANEQHATSKNTQGEQKTRLLVRPT